MSGSLSLEEHIALLQKINFGNQKIVDELTETSIEVQDTIDRLNDVVKTLDEENKKLKCRRTCPSCGALSEQK